MTQRVKKRSEKRGLPPGSLVHVGKESSQPARMTLIEYDKVTMCERPLTTVAEAKTCINTPAVSWINIDGLSDVKLVSETCEAFGIHPLVTEDILNSSIRPKYEHHPDYLVVILKMILPSTVGANSLKRGSFVTEQVSFVLGKNWLLTFQESATGDVFDRVRERIRREHSRIRDTEADYLCYALMDAVVDGYFVVLETVGEEIEQLEQEITDGKQTLSLQEIHSIRVFALSLRRSVWPVREIMAAIGRDGSPFINQSTHIYLRDIYDHAVEAMDMLESFREMVAGLMELYLSFVSHQMNSVMMVLTGATVIFMPLTFIVGIYGMNFDYMPELHWKFGYPLVLLLMLTIAISMITYFRKRKWL